MQIERAGLPCPHYAHAAASCTLTCQVLDGLAEQMAAAGVLVSGC